MEYRVLPPSSSPSAGGSLPLSAMGGKDQNLIFLKSEVSFDYSIVSTAKWNSRKSNHAELGEQWAGSQCRMSLHMPATMPCDVAFAPAHAESCSESKARPCVWQNHFYTPHLLECIFGQVRETLKYRQFIDLVCFNSHIPVRC